MSLRSRKRKDANSTRLEAVNVGTGWFRAKNGDAYAAGLTRMTTFKNIIHPASRSRPAPARTRARWRRPPPRKASIGWGLFGVAVARGRRTPLPHAARVCGYGSVGEPLPSLAILGQHQDSATLRDARKSHEALGSTTRVWQRATARNGRGWDRTSDPSRVKRVLSR